MVEKKKRRYEWENERNPGYRRTLILDNRRGKKELLPEDNPDDRKLFSERHGGAAGWTKW